MRRLVINLATAGLLVAVAVLSINAQPHAQVQVNVNTATPAQLMYLPGVGVVMSQRIVDYRTEHGKFVRVSDLRQVKGIGERKLAVMRAFVTVSGPTTAQGKIHAFRCTTDTECEAEAAKFGKVGAK